jgi:hypothetical protein
MTQPDKELELLQKASDQLTTTITRVSLLRLFVLAVLVFTFANAFKQIDPQTMRELEVLEPVTKVEVATFNLDRFQDFFVLNRLFSEQSVSFTGSPTSERTSPAFNQSVWDQVRPILIRFSKDNKVIIEEKSSQIAQAIQDNKQEELPLEIIESAVFVQQQLAQQIRKNYRDAFSSELGLVGTKTSVDLRNWLAFLPFIFLFSEAYLLIQRKKQKLLNSVLAKRVEQAEAAAPNSVPTAYRLLLEPVRTPAAYARHPNQLVEILYLICSVGLLVYFVVAARSFLAGVSFSQNFLTIAIPVCFTLIIATLYTWFYYRSVSIGLEEQLRRQEDLVTEPPRFVLWAEKIKNLFQRPFRHAPRFWLTTGGGLVLITLLMTVSLDSCGGPRRGYKLLTKPANVESVEMDSVTSSDPTAWWPTALFSTTRFDETLLTNAGLRYFIGLNQRLGRIAYIVGLLTATVTLFLVMLSFVRHGALHNRAINVLLLLTCGGALLFILADFCFYFVTPRWKLVVLGIYMIGSLLLALLSGLSDYRNASDQLSRWKFIMKSLWMPVALCAVLLLLLFGILVGLDIGKEFLAEKQFGVRVGAGLVFELIVKNFAVGILTLVIGLKLMLLGWRQLYRSLASVR